MGFCLGGVTPVGERTVLFDLDGTLVDCSHRLPHIKGSKKDWDAFYKDVMLDTPIQPIIDLLYSLEVSNRIVLCSGRPKDYFHQTVDWVDEHIGFGYVSAIYMRPSGDFRKDHVVKAELLEQIKVDGYDPWLVVDDRSSVVAMWRSKGLVCLQCREWEESKYPPGELIMMVGPSGAGKTKYLADIKPLEASIISSDKIRQELCGDFRDQTKNAQVFSVVHAIASARIKHGLPCFIDATNLKRADRLALIEKLPVTTTISYVVVDRPMEEKVRDAGWRPQWLLEKHQQTFYSQLPDILAGDHLSNVKVVDLRK